MGMTCASCANRIERKLNKIDGVMATVNYATEKARVVFPEDFDPVELVRTVESAGYGATLPRPDDGGARGRGRGTVDDPTRALRQRLVISTVLTVPVIALAMVPAWQFTYWQWLSPSLSRRRSWCGAPGRSTGPPGSTSSTARRRWTRWSPSGRWRLSAGRSTHCSGGRRVSRA